MTASSKSGDGKRGKRSETAGCNVKLSCGDHLLLNCVVVSEHTNVLL